MALALLIGAACIPALIRHSLPPARAAEKALAAPSRRQKTAGWQGELRPARSSRASAHEPAARSGRKLEPKKRRVAVKKVRRPRRRHLRVWATGYCPTCRVCDTGKITATGRRAFSRGVAVAETGRRALPLGSRVYVPRFGWLRVDDTGGGVRSDQIDIRFQSHRRAVQWGRRLVEVSLDG